MTYNFPTTYEMSIISGGDNVITLDGTTLHTLDNVGDFTISIKKPGAEFVTYLGKVVHDYSQFELGDD